jgi:thioester reductase-like protein
MGVFVTGATGYLGSYVVTRLLRAHEPRVLLLVRAKSTAEAQQRLWHALQLHMSFAEFERHLHSRIDVYLGDITEARCGLTPAAHRRLVSAMSSAIHIAASLNRRSARASMNVNLRGTMNVIELARAAHDVHGLRRFSDVSTTAVAGERSSEVVQEDSAVDWKRRDYDPYAYTKKFCEHMVESLLPDVPTTVFRPSTVIGDTRSGSTTQFDMVRAVLALARMRVLPLRPDGRHDIVPADYVARAIADIHQREAPRHRIYHLSAGTGSETHAEMMANLRIGGRPLRHAFVPVLQAPFGWAISALANAPRGLAVTRPASLMRVFWPYVVFDTVFDNRRVVEELGDAPLPFSRYGSAVLDFAIEHAFSYPYQPWPAGQLDAEAVPSPA